MKAKNIDGTIKTYNSTPKSWGNVIGGFDLLTDSQLESYGFYNIEDIKTTHSDFDSRIHNKGSLSFDSDNNIYIWSKENKTWTQTLAELKTQTITNLKYSYQREIGKTDWKVTKYLEKGESVPQSLKDEREALRVECNNHEDSINSKNSKSDVITYDLPNFM